MGGYLRDRQARAVGRGFGTRRTITGRTGIEELHDATRDRVDKAFLRRRCAVGGHQSCPPTTASSTSISRSSSRTLVSSSAALQAARRSALAKSRRSAGVSRSRSIPRILIYVARSVFGVNWAISDHRRHKDLIVETDG